MSKEFEDLLGSRPAAIVEHNKTTESHADESSRSTLPTTPKRHESEPYGNSSNLDRDVPLGVVVPASVKVALGVKAAVDGTTMRALVLAALKDSGIDVPERELRDRRNNHGQPSK